MIRRLTGKIETSVHDPDHVLIDVNGVGYRVRLAKRDLPFCFTTLQISTIQTEDSTTLYGFALTEARDMFEDLLGKVKGVGPKIAFSLIGNLGVDGFKLAVTQQDLKAMKACPGVGTKTAEMVLVSFHDKFGPSAEAKRPAPPALDATKAKDLKAALTGLGYKATEAQEVINAKITAEHRDLGIQDLIKVCLKK